MIFRYIKSGVVTEADIDIEYTHAMGFRELITRCLINGDGVVVDATEKDMANSIFLVFADIKKII